MRLSWEFLLVVVDRVARAALLLAQSGLEGSLRRSHLSELLQVQARVGVFADSGAWETALLRLFDRVFRGGVWATLLPISDHSIGERAAAKLSGVLLTYVTDSSTRSLFCVNHLLRVLGAGCGILFGLGLMFGLGLGLV